MIAVIGIERSKDTFINSSNRFGTIADSSPAKVNRGIGMTSESTDSPMGSTFHPFFEVCRSHLVFLVEYFNSVNFLWNCRMYVVTSSVRSFFMNRTGRTAAMITKIYRKTISCVLTELASCVSRVCVCASVCVPACACVCQCSCVSVCLCASDCLSVCI